MLIFKKILVWLVCLPFVLFGFCYATWFVTYDSYGFIVGKDILAHLDNVDIEYPTGPEEWMIARAQFTYQYNQQTYITETDIPVIVAWLIKSRQDSNMIIDLAPNAPRDIWATPHWFYWLIYGVSDLSVAIIFYYAGIIIFKMLVNGKKKNQNQKPETAR